MADINLTALLADVFECLPEDVTREARINETPGWNSLSHVALMLRLGEFDCAVPMSRIPDLTSYEAVAAFVAESGGRVID